MESRRCLTIQSMVAVGYVGNKAATFPLQLLEYEVDVVNTVEFSNHTGYRQWGGSKMTVQHLRSVFDQFTKNGFYRHSHLLTGYIPGPEALEVVIETVETLRTVNPDLIYVCDPVLGDDGKIYVQPECIPLYKQLIPKATLITPNDFEAELLTDIKIESTESLRRCLHHLHAHYHLPHAVVSSCHLPPAELLRLAPSLADGPCLTCAGSSRIGTVEQPWIIVFPAFAEHFEGVGDVFSSLMLAHFGVDRGEAPSSLARAAELSIASLSAIIARTRARALRLAGGDADALLDPVDQDEALDIRAQRLRRLELQLVQSHSDIVNPSIDYRAISI